MLEIVQLLVYGLVLGSIVSLGAIGVSLTFGILGFANFSHGDLMAFGAYVALTLYSFLSLPMAVALPAAIVATVLLALALDRTVYRRFRTSRPVILLIASFGIALIVRSAIQLIWGPDTHLYVSGIQLPHRIHGIRIRPSQMTILVLAILLMLAVHVLLQYTKVGKAMRAMADNPELARLSGIDTERVVVWTWMVGAGLAAAAGIFLGLDTRVQPDMGWFILLPVFAAAILGGIGKPYGAIAGGLIIGVSQELSTLVLSPAYKPAVAFALMVLMLIVRPTGLFGGRSL